MKSTFKGLLVAVFFVFCVSLLGHSEAQKSQTLILHGRDEPQTLDPGLTSGIVDANIVMNIFEGLTRYHPKTLEPQPAIAESWSISPNGLVYTFKLRDSVWSDGKPLTAIDFFDSWERVLRPETASVYAYQLYYIKNGEAYNQGKMKDPKLLGMRVVNPKTFEVTLEHPTPYFLKLTPFHTYLPVPKAVVEKHGDRWAFPDTIVSNGAFLLSGWTPQKEVVLKKNPKYWDAKNVRLNEVKFLPVPEYETALKMFEIGQLDHVFELPPLKVKSLENRPDFLRFPYLATSYYWLNVKVKPLDDPRVRQALALSIDRKTITDKVLRRGDFPLNSFVPPRIPGYEPVSVPDIFNPVKAKQLLKEAGYGEGGKPFPVLEILYNTTKEHRTVAEVIQNMWKTNLGIEVTLRNEEWKTYLKTLDMHQFQIGRGGWVGDYTDANTFLHLLYSKSQGNNAQFDNPQFDELFKKAGREQDLSKRTLILREAEAIVMREFPVIPLYSEVKNFLLHPKVKGYYATFLDIHPLYGVSIEEAQSAEAQGSATQGPAKNP